VEAAGDMPEEVARRMAVVERIFAPDDAAVPPGRGAPAEIGGGTATLAARRIRPAPRSA
jgi:hypothetical protein